MIRYQALLWAEAKCNAQAQNRSTVCKSRNHIVKTTGTAGAMPDHGESEKIKLRLIFGFPEQGNQGKPTMKLGFSVVVCLVVEAKGAAQPPAQPVQPH